MEKLIHKFIDQNVKNVDTYQHNGSTWLIFTEDKKWVIELTKDKTLWYNYNFFKSIFEFFSMDLVEYQHYITKWVENNIINNVKGTHRFGYGVENDVEDTIQNGVKHTLETKAKLGLFVEDTIQNGVKQIYSGGNVDISDSIEDTIENGVKIKPALESHEGFMIGTPYVDKFFSKEEVESTIQNGVKQTHRDAERHPKSIEETIENGVKETKSDEKYISHFRQQYKSEKVIQNLEIKTFGGVGGQKKVIKDIIDNGIKETQPLPAQDGNRDWGNYYHRQEDRTKPHNQYVNDVITLGVKDTKPMDEWVNTENIVKKVIKNGEIKK